MKSPLTSLNSIARRLSPGFSLIALGRGLAFSLAILVFTSVSYGQSNQCVAVPSGLIGWWSAEGNATDFTGEHSGTFPFGSAFAAGEVGQAFDFDGSYRRVSIADSPAFQLTNAMTLEAWVYPRAYGGFITFRGDNRGGLDTWTIDTYETGYIKFQIDDEANNYQSVRAPLTLNQWQHVAATWDRASGAMKIYVNGVLAQATNTTVIPIGALDSGSEPAIGIGNHGGTFHQFPFNGLIDELGIYNRALTANEVAGIYAAQSAGKCSSTNPPPSNCTATPMDAVSWWRAENNPLDELSTNHGALVGGMGYGSGRVGQAFVFDGADDGVVIPDAAALNVGPGQDFTVEAWIQAEPHTTEYGVMSILSKRVAPTLVNAQGFELALHYGKLGGQLADERQQISNFISTGPDLIDGAYHHVAMTVTRAATNGGRFYVDGQVVLVFDPTVQPGDLSTTAPFRIGRHASDWFNGSFKGRVDEATFYRRALASNEIATIYTAGTAGKCTMTNPPMVNCTPAPSGVISWWRGESNFWDSVQSNHGSAVGGVSFVPGKAGLGMRFDGSSHVVIPHHPSLDCSNALTIEFWYQPDADYDVSYGLIDKRVGGAGANYGINNSSFAGLGVYYDDANVLDGDDTIYGSVFEASRYLPAPVSGVFHHLAATFFQLGSNTVQLETYIDGQKVRTKLINGNLASTLNTTPVTIGATAQGAGEFFKGIIDEVALYARVLTSAEVAAIYNAGSAGKCPPQFSQPGILQQPQSVTTNVSATVRFDVIATGVPTPTYQWFFGNAPLANQTNAVLLLSNVQPANAGLYSVQVSNIAGLIVSSNAVLNVDLTQPAWLVDANSIGFYNDALGTTLDGTAPQFPIPFGTGGGDPEFYPADEPNLAAGATILGNWLSNPSALNSNWRSVASIPTTWELNTETAIIYAVDGGQHGVSNLRADIDADNGIYVWVNGKYKFGARQPGLPSPLGQYEYTNVFLGELAPGSNYIQILREDSGIADGYQFRLSGTVLATNQPPIITQSPATQTAIGGNTVTFNAAAIGSSDLTFRWQFNGITLGGQSNTSLTLANVPLSQAGDYTFVATNPYGAATSSIATLTVLAFPPVITRQPTNVTAIETTAASFSVQATGSVTLAYQWLFNNAPLAGKTAASLTFTSVQFSNAGNYSVIVINPYGLVTSSVATLTVNPRPPCVPVQDGLVSWWRAENNALDGWDSNNGQFPLFKYVTGKVGLAFSQPLVHVPDAPSLRFTNGMTFEAWINPSSLSGSTPRTIISKYDYPSSQTGTQNSFIFCTTNNGALFFAVSPNGSYRTNTAVVTTNVLPINQWTHVAATYDGAALRIFINGSVAAERSYTNGIFPGTLNISLGGISAAQAPTSSPWQFTGLLDEASLYNRALSVAEIQSIFAADLTGKCLAPPVITQQPQDQTVPLGEDVKLTATVVGSRPLTYRWKLNGTNIFNGTNAFLLIEKIKANNAGLYSLAVTNGAGFDISTTAQVSLVPAPSCTEILPGLISWWTGDTNNLDVMGLNNIIAYSPVSYPTGKVASAFTFNGITSRVQINNSTSLNFTNNQNFSIELWVKANPTNTTYANVPLLEKRDATTSGWRGYSLSLNNGRLAFSLAAVGLPSSTYVSSGPDLRDGMFHHMAVTLNRTNNTGGVLYVDGAPVLVFDPRTHTNSLLNTTALFIGAPALTVSDSYFSGLIDEPALYNRALTAAEILSIRTAGAAGRCKAPPFIVTQPASRFVTNGESHTLSVVATGMPAPRYQWRRNNISVSNGTNSTLSLSNISTINAGNYSVIVSNAFGSVLSSNAAVVINRLPVANADAFPTASNTPAVFPAAKLLLNDTDADGDPLTVTAVSAISAQNGTVTLLSGMVTYSPPSGFGGNDTFTYTIGDGRGGTAVGTVMVTVGNGGAAPLNIVSGPMVDAGDFVVRFAGIPGLDYTIEAAPDLAGPWVKVANLVAPATNQGLGIGIFEFREPIGAHATRFYRTIYPSY